MSMLFLLACTTSFRDLDGDGFSLAQGDCADDDPTRYPGAPEICDGVDDDCDGTVDGADALDGLRWYVDEDGDGYGSAPGWGCEAPDDAVEDGGDCDETDAQVHPGVAETCDGVDQDCDGQVDEEPSDVEGGYEDLDGDGWGGLWVQDCEMPDHVLDVGGDCDDLDPEVHPEAAEACNGIDDDCDGAADDEDPEGPSVGAAIFYPDQDGDGFGVPDGASLRCEPAAGWAENAADCDDEDALAGDECGWKDIGCSGYHGCALRQNGAAECFGSTYLGEAPFVDEHPNPGESFDAISTNRTGFVCGLRSSDGGVQCWGYNPPTEALEGSFVALDETNGEVCGEDHDGRVSCTGGLGGPSDPVRAWGCGYKHCVAQLEGGELRFWGTAIYFPGAAYPTLPETDYQSFSGGKGFVCGLDFDGAVHCAGLVSGSWEGPYVDLATTYDNVIRLPASGTAECSTSSGACSFGLPGPHSVVAGGHYCTAGISLDGQELSCLSVLGGSNACRDLPN